GDLIPHHSDSVLIPGAGGNRRWLPPSGQKSHGERFCNSKGDYSFFRSNFRGEYGDSALLAEVAVCDLTSGRRPVIEICVEGCYSR
ncbi:hypothetical protein BgiMline_030574, partial [Biomphalaria glabrata]